MIVDLKKYIGVPHVAHGVSLETGVDCWGLTREFYRLEFHLLLPEHIVEYQFGEDGKLKQDSADEAIKCYLQNQAEGFIDVEKPGFGDIILFRTGALITHIGVAINHKAMLNSKNGIGVCMEEFTNRYWNRRIEGFYRHVNRVSR